MHLKSKPLITSMSYRCDHSYGLQEPEQQAVLFKEMSALYDLFAQGLSNEDIDKQLKYGCVTIMQLREEVDGRGFYQERI